MAIAHLPNNNRTCYRYIYTLGNMWIYTNEVHLVYCAERIVVIVRAWYWFKRSQNWLPSWSADPHKKPAFGVVAWWSLCSYKLAHLRSYICLPPHTRFASKDDKTHLLVVPQWDWTRYIYIDYVDNSSHLVAYTRSYTLLWEYDKMWGNQVTDMWIACVASALFFHLLRNWC